MKANSSFSVLMLSLTDFFFNSVRKNINPLFFKTLAMKILIYENMGWLLFQIERKYTFDDLCNVRLKNVKFCKKSLYLAVDLPETLPAEYMNETLMADDEGYYNTAEFNTDIHVEDLQRVVSEKSARENNTFQSEYRVLLSLYLTTKPHFFNEPETNYSKPDK